MRKFRHLIPELVALLAISSGCMLSYPYIQEEVSIEQAKQALSFAIKEEGKPYVLGGQDPDIGFDCSGIVVWTYSKTVDNLLFKRRGRIVSDIEVEYLYSENITPLKLEDVVPGDIVFISNKEGIVNHCGLVVSKGLDCVRIIHASGGLGKVIIEDWKMGEEIRGGRIHSFGRLKIVKILSLTRI